jgi:hypothetical protein
MVAVFFVCVLITAGPALEVFLYYKLGLDWSSIGRTTVYAISNTEFSNELLQGIAALIAVAVVIVANPARHEIRWSALWYGSMGAIGVCFVMILVYSQAQVIINDLQNNPTIIAKHPELGRGLSDQQLAAIVDPIAKSIVVFYTVMGVWFAGFMFKLSRMPRRRAARAARNPT